MNRLRQALVRSLLAAAAACLLTQCGTVGGLPAPAPARLPAELCYVDTVAPLVRADLKYAGSDNFVGRPIKGYTGRRPVLRRDAAAALRKASQILAKQGYGILVWDAYRPARAMDDFYDWSRTPDDSTRATFYPNITKRGIYENRYIGRISEHSWCVALDLTLFRLSDGKELDMGTRHDFLDAAAATDSPLVTAKQRANRHILKSAMEQAGFRNYSKEWWHYFLADMKTCFTYNFPLNDNLESRK